MNQYNPDEHHAGTVLSAYTLLGSAITAALEDLRTQRERADAYIRDIAELHAELDVAQTDAAKLRIYVAQLEALLTREQTTTAAATAKAQWDREHGL